MIRKLGTLALVALVLVVTLAPATAQAKPRSIEPDGCYVDEWDGNTHCYGSEKKGANITWAHWVYDPLGALISFFTETYNVVNGNTR